MGADTPEQVVPLRIPVHHLRDDQQQLLRSVLRAGDVPVAITRGELITGQAYADEVDKALEWVTAAAGPAPDEDDDHVPVREPLVKPSRPPLADGRRQATRWRRLSAGLVDEAVISVPTILAADAGAPAWTVAVIHAAAHVVPVAMFGWTFGKLWCGLRVVDRRTLRTPGPISAVVRWIVAALPLLVALATGMNGDLRTVLMMAVYAPIVWDLRGLHDRAAGTLVVERSTAGPGLWVRRPRPSTKVA